MRGGQRMPAALMRTIEQVTSPIALPPTVRLASRPVLRWTDDPVTTETPIKAVHVNELRRAIDTLRSQADLASFTWTDDPIMAGGTVIRAIHFLELRQAIQDLWEFARLGTLPAWTAGSPPSPERVVFTSDVNDLRCWGRPLFRPLPSNADPRGQVVRCQ
jgi:hypothetical protein